MKGLAASFLGLLVMACSGCGGGESADPAPQQPAVQAQQKPSIVIAAEGDSTIWGQQTIDSSYARSAHPAPAVTQSILREQFGDTVTVSNQGRGGATAREAIVGQPRYDMPFAQRMATDPARIVVMNWAINDYTRSSRDDYRESLIAAVNIVRAAGKIAVLEEPNPICIPGGDDMEKYVAIMRTVAVDTRTPLIAQYDYIRSLPDWKGMLTDCLHPNDDLYAIKGQKVAIALAPIVAGIR
ncbi:SGNH/GDSL hydrolase family protein [Cupriavidus sp. D384]|uniref:SGNH/GDSL hydrolase family protein n=1 Tax=Cupriavidus sp. D384 TaxID=1538095 RepID=UPI00082F35D0|nr:SGNH/GDSL hydrolase family protein [Cupriavidus sp. D384]